jgi:uncharacterized protein YdhG (YjbR/CyaY superfamily)
MFNFMVQQLPEIDAYIEAAPDVARPILRNIRGMARDLCPDAQEVISYKMPALRQDRVFFYYAAFKNHIGIYPPLKQDKRLIAELAPYRGPKGNLQFPCDGDIPYTLIGKVIAALHKEYAVKR